MLNKRIYGLIGISSIMSNWNADFSGYPKSTSLGDCFGSDKALKYPMKKMWDESDEKVLYIKSLKIDKGEGKKKGKDKKEDEGIKVRPKSLKERYEEIFNVNDLKEEKDTEKVLKNLFKAIDVKQFGATFAEEKNNISITGAVQISQGFNKYEGHTVEEQQILSPFRDGTKDEADSSTLGTKIVSSEAHYIYSFVINPKAYKDFVKMGVTDGYKEEDYKKFKEAALISATSFNTNAKIGCENELGVFIQGDEKLYLPDLAQYVEFEKSEGINVIKLNFSELLNILGDRIDSIEVYYNPYKTKITGIFKKAKYFNIFTKEEVK